jgi:O-antigen/teichoic acid export membrane protein
LVLIFIFISFSGSFQHYLLSKDLDPLLVKIMVLSVPFYIVYQNLRQILRSQEKIIEYNVLTMIFFFSTLFTTTLCLAFIQNKLFGAVCGYVLGVFITSIIAYHAVNKNIKVRFGINLDLLKKMVNFGFRNYLGTLFQYLNYRIDLLLILPLAGAYETGLYVTAVTIAERIWDIPDSIRVVIQPRITAISDEDAQELTSSVTRITIFPLILLSVGIAFSGRLLIGLLFGPEYYNSYLPLVILLPGIVAFSISKYLASHLTGRGNPQISSYAAFISLIVNILLNSYLIRYWGGVGAAIASSATYFCATLYLIIQFLSRSSLHLKDLLLMKSADFKNICNSLNSLWSYQSIRR